VKQERNLSGHYFLRAVILFGFAIYIVHLVKTGNILYYIAPHTVIYVKLSGLGFYAVAIYQLTLAFGSLWKRKPADPCEHLPSTSRWHNFLFYSLFMIPLFLGFLLPDQGMGSSLAAKRGVNISPGLNLAAEASLHLAPPTPAKNTVPLTAAQIKLNELFQTDKYDAGFADIGKNLYQKPLVQVKADGFIETLTTLNMFMNHFIGKQVEITGFVYREDDMLSNQFVVARFSVQCCSADATPYGVMVDYAGGGNFANDSWVHVTGTIEQSTYNGNEVMIIQATKAAKTSANKAPYVYPDPNFTGQ